MYKTRMIALIGLTIFAQGAMASTIWLKDIANNVCTNSGITDPKNPSKIIGLGGINADGTGFTMTIDNPAGPGKPTTGGCAGIPATVNPLVFPAGSVVGNIVPVSMIKPGTNGANECLNQGNNLSGVTSQTSLGAGAGKITLAFTYANPTPGCLANTYQAPFTRGVVIARGALGNVGGVVTLYQGNYHIFNPATVPEPSSILLLLAGFLGMGFLVWRR